MSHKYTPEQRGEAVAAVQATATIESARELLAEVWGSQAPTAVTLWRWAQSGDVEADGDFLKRIEGERLRSRNGRLHTLFDRIGSKLLAEVDHLEPGSSWRGVKDGAISLGILRDKIDPPMRSVTALSVNTEGGPAQIIMPFGPKEPDDGSA